MRIPCVNLSYVCSQNPIELIEADFWEGADDSAINFF